MDKNLLKIAIAVVCCAYVLIFGWNFSLTHSDYQVWIAAEKIAGEGQSPYDSVLLNKELVDNGDNYGNHWNASDAQEMFFFNPPSFLTQLKVFNFSPFITSAVGLVATYISLLVLGRRTSELNFATYSVSAACVFSSSMGVSTFNYGQVGLLLSGLIGLNLLLSSNKYLGVPIALLSFKPHIAFASGVTNLVRNPKTTVVLIAVPAAALFFVTSYFYGFSSWLEWVEGNLNSKVGQAEDMTFRSIFPRSMISKSWEFPVLLLATVAVGLSNFYFDKADKKLLILMSIGVIIFFSGHGFVHDWLWIVFIPPVMNWSGFKTLLATVLVVAMHMWGEAYNAVEKFLLLSPLSMLGILVIGYLIYAVWNSHKVNSIKENESVIKQDLALAN